MTLLEDETESKSEPEIGGKARKRRISPDLVGITDGWGGLADAGDKCVGERHRTGV